MSKATGHDIYAWTADWALKAELSLWKAEETASTNSIAKDDAEEATIPRLLNENAEVSEPSLYLARHQTKGRGRGQNTWSDTQGGALLSSWSFALRLVPQPILSPLVGLALFEAAKHVWSDVDFNIKAPNDLYLGNKKIAGLLIETIDQGASKRTVIGLGFNAVGHPELETATDLASHVGQLTKVQWSLFLDAWVAQLKAAMREGLSSYLVPDAQERLKHALNQHPLLKEPIMMVDAMGQLHTSSRVISWHEL